MDWIGIITTAQRVDWPTLSNIAVVISALFLIRQLNEMRRTTHAQSYSVAMQHLQAEDVRQARKIVFQLHEKPLEEWNKEDIAAAERVCHTYDVVGQMVRHKLLPKDTIIDSWGPSLRNSLPILLPLVHKYRAQYDAREYWEDYEWLAQAARKSDAWRRKRWLLQDKFTIPKVKAPTVPKVPNMRVVKAKKRLTPK